MPTVQTAIEPRSRARFLKALAAAKKSQNEWAREQGITKGHLSLVLNGHRFSKKLIGKIEQFARSA